MVKGAPANTNVPNIINDLNLQLKAKAAPKIKTDRQLNKERKRLAQVRCPQCNSQVARGSL